MLTVMHLCITDTIFRVGLQAVQHSKQQAAQKERCTIAALQGMHHAAELRQQVHLGACWVVCNSPRPSDGGIADHQPIYSQSQANCGNVGLVCICQVRGQLDEQGRRPPSTPLHLVPGVLHPLD